MLTLTTHLVRDVPAVWTLATAGVALLSVSSGRPAARTITGGALVRLAAFGGYLAPIDKGRFFDRGATSAMLTVALTLWAMAFTHFISTTTRRHLHRL